MNKVSEITRESRVLNTFTEWGIWLNEEIENEMLNREHFLCGGLAVQEFG